MGQRRTAGYIVSELIGHAPFTAVGAAAGIVVMVVLAVARTPQEISGAVFYILHPGHVVLSALATTAMYRQYGRGRLWTAMLVGYTGAIGIATLSDAIIPYLGGSLLNIEMEFHIPFIETEIIPYIQIPKWVAVNAGAVIGIAIGYLKPATKFPHAGHVLLSTWASLFGFTAFGIADWIPQLPFIFLFLFLAVWVPCCISDVVYPLLWVRPGQHHHH